MDAVRAALASLPRQPHRLLDALHLVRDACGGIDPAAERAIAEHLGLMHGRVAETVSFYSYLTHGRRLVRPCTGLACHLKGGTALLHALKEGDRPLFLEKGDGPLFQKNAGDAGAWAVMEVPCLGRCEMAPVALVGAEVVPHATAEDCRAATGRDGEGPRTGPVGDPAEREWRSIPLGAPLADLAAWRALGGLEALGRVASGALPAEAVLAELDAASLVGCGGAGFPTARKWGFLLKQREEGRTVVVNADEGEPGTFKDRWIMERNPFVLLEGTLIAARTVRAAEAIVYVREEYDHCIARLRAAVGEMRAAGLLAATAAGAPAVDLRLAVGAGAYICGEETALLESLEGRRGMPRLKPPYPIEVGYLGRPTLINNVETLSHVPAILRRGGAWFASQGVRGGKGLRLFSLSGDVARPGVYELPVGTTARELIEDHGGGVPGGRRVKAFVPGGAASGFLAAEHLDVPMDLKPLRDAGSGLGSAAVIVLDETRSIREAAAELLRFFEEESCQQCTPCRLGTRALHDLLRRDASALPPGTPGFVQRVDAALRDTSICGLGMAASMPLTTAMRFFPGELEGFRHG
jgi:formate dehydrogenase